MSWQEATLPTDGSMAFSWRITVEEKQRLETLRQEFRLTSRGQVIRAALDLLEATTAAGDVLTGSDLETTRRIGRRLRRDAGVPRRSDVQAASADDATAKRRKVKTRYTHVVNGPAAASSGSPTDAAPDRSTEGV